LAVRGRGRRVGKVAQAKDVLIQHVSRSKQRPTRLFFLYIYFHVFLYAEGALIKRVSKIGGK